MKSKKKDTETKPKIKGLFDHINHIREIKDPNYYVNLTDEEKKSFNKFMILRVLSMDINLIEEMSILSKYFQLIPDEQFYKVLIDIVPRGRKFCKYIKKSTENINQTILDCICNKFKIGEKDATDYFNILISYESGTKELVSLIEGFGFNKKEIEELFKQYANNRGNIGLC
jgi:hypothetical protein